MRTTPTACLQELFECVVEKRVSRARSTRVARRRACPPVPKCTRLVPARNRNLAFAGNTICLFAGLLCKPSDGLEPSTPSLPWRFTGGIGVHDRASAGMFFPANRAVEPCLSCPRVPARAPADVPVSYPAECCLLAKQATDRTSTFSWFAVDRCALTGARGSPREARRRVRSPECTRTREPAGRRRSPGPKR